MTTTELYIYLLSVLYRMTTTELYIYISDDCAEQDDYH